MPKRFVVAASDFPEVPHFPMGFELADALTVAAQQLHETSTANAALRAAARLAVHVLPGAEHAGISVIEKTHRQTLAWTDEVVRSADALNAGREHHLYWSRLWTAPVARIDDSAAYDSGELSFSGLGLRSVLSLRLRADRRRLTVLTAYARKPRAFDDSATRIGRLFTAHVSIALESVTAREQLTEAMRTRDLIGQATGILMERLGIDAGAAFESLVRTSQRENVKLRDLARRLVDTLHQE
ncbi:ANTAR domain-containing protein [Streptomyces sp. NPDC058274]|jgi:GAF domain-containing protein|uniref:ANTAR domain-containing protein n=1 Tax=Streptomyces sp. NPDC058274 TaxID=3346416 RepID=UPI0036E2F6B5